MEQVKLGNYKLYRYSLQDGDVVLPFDIFARSKKEADYLIDLYKKKTGKTLVFYKLCKTKGDIAKVERYYRQYGDNLYQEQLNRIELMK